MSTSRKQVVESDIEGLFLQNNEKLEKNHAPTVSRNNIFIDSDEDSDEFEHIIINKNVDFDSDYSVGSSSVGVGLESNTECKPKMKNLQLRRFIKRLIDPSMSTTTTEYGSVDFQTTPTILENDPKELEGKAIEGQEFQYVPQKNLENHTFELFMKRATFEFIKLRDFRERLALISRWLVDSIKTSESTKPNFESEIPLSPTVAWIWMCAEIVEHFHSSEDILHCPGNRAKCKELIFRNLAKFPNRLKTLNNYVKTIENGMKDLNAKFLKELRLKTKFSGAISTEVDKLRTRFVQESKERSVEVGVIRSEISLIKQLKGDQEPTEYVGWGIDGLSLKTVPKSSHALLDLGTRWPPKNPRETELNFVLLNAIKKNSKQFFEALESFFNGLDNFWEHAHRMTYDASLNLPKLYNYRTRKFGSRSPFNYEVKIQNLVSLSKAMGYLYPMEQARSVHAIWQIEYVLSGCLEFCASFKKQLKQAQMIWRKTFDVKNYMKVSFEPFVDWKLCRELTFQLDLDRMNFTRKRGLLSLAIPNKCHSNLPLYFQVFETRLFGLIDFTQEYKHRADRIKGTRVILEEDVMLCSDRIQYIHCNVSSTNNKIKTISDTLNSINQKLLQTIEIDSSSNNLMAVNVWFFIGAESIQAMNSQNIDSKEEQDFLLEFETCFRLLDQWLNLLKTLIQKYLKELRQIQKCVVGFEEITPDIPDETSSADSIWNSSQNNLLAKADSNILDKILEFKAKLDYDGLQLENSGTHHSLRTIELPYFSKTIKLFQNHMKCTISSAIDIYTETIELIYCYKSAQRRVDGRKEIKASDGIRNMIKAVRSELQKPIKLNSLEVLVCHCGLSDLEKQMIALIKPLQNILSIKPIMRELLEYPRMVLKNKRSNKLLQPGNDVSSVADFIGRSVTIPINEKPLVGELRKVLANANVVAEKSPIWGSISSERSKESLAVPVVAPPSVTNTIGSKLTNLESDFDLKVFTGLNRLKISLQRSTAVYTPCNPVDRSPVSIQEEQRSIDVNPANLQQTYFIRTVAVLTIVSLQHSQQNWSKNPNSALNRNVERMFKKLQHLQKDVSYFRESLAKLNQRLLMAMSLIFERGSSAAKCEQFNSIDWVQQNNVDNNSLTSIIPNSTTSATAKEILLSFKRNEEFEDDTTEFGRLALNFTGYEKKKEVRDLPSNGQLDVIETMVTSLETIFSRQRKHVDKLRGEKKVFQSLDKLAPNFTAEDSTNIHSFHRQIELAKENLQSVDKALEKTSSAFKLCLNLLKLFTTGTAGRIGKGEPELFSLEELKEELEDFPTEVYVACKRK